MNVFDLQAVITLNKKGFEAGMDGVKKALDVTVKAIGIATTAVAGFAAASVKTGSEFDKAMAQVAATSGKTVDEIGELRDFAQEMGSTTAFSATQAAEALNFMALAGYDAETSMAMLPNVLDLAASGAMDLATASDMITDTQTAFGISLERTSQMVDEMAKAASTGNTSVSQLGEAFLTVGGLAKELNGGMVTLADGTQVEVDGVQELEIALTAMANAGIKGSEAGTHMRNMLLKLSSPTDAGATALENLGVAVFDAGGNMRSLQDIMGDLGGAMGDLTQEEKLQAISDIFNARDVASAEALLAAVGQDWNAIGEAILDADGAAKQMAETQLDNLAGDVTLFKSALEGFQIAISDELTPSLRDFVQFGSDGLSRLTSAFKTGGLSAAMGEFGTILSDGLAMVIDKLPALVDAGGQLLGAFVKGIIDNAPKIIDAAAEIATTLLESLVNATSNRESQILKVLTIIVDKLSDPSFIVHFVNLGVSLMENLFKGISDPSTIRHLVLTAGTIVEQLLRGITELLPTIVSAGATMLSSLINGLAMELPYLLPQIVDVVLGLVDALTTPDNIVMLVQAGVDFLLALAQGLLDAIPEIVDKIPVIVDNLLTALTDSIPLLIDAGIQLITAIVEDLPTIIEHIVAIIPQIVDSLIATITSPKTIEALVLGAIDIVIEIVKNLPRIILSLIKAIPTIITSIIDAFFGIVGGFGDVFLKALNKIKEVFANVGGWFKEKFENAKEKAAAAWSGIKDKMSQNWENTKAVFSKIGDWAKEKWGNAKEKAHEAWQGIKDHMQKSYEDQQAVYNKIGEWASEKWGNAKEKAHEAWQGIKDYMSTSWENQQAVFAKIGDWASEKWGNAKEKANEAWQGIKDYMSTTWDNVKNVYAKVGEWASDKWNDAKEKASKAWDKIKDASSDTWQGVQNVYSKVQDWFGDKFQNAKEKAVGAWDNIKTAFSNIWGRIKEGFSISDALSWGKDMLDNFISGITSKIQAVKDAVGNVAGVVKSFLGFSEPEKGPLSDFHTYAPDMMNLFIQGIKDNQNALQNAVAGAFDFQDLITAPTMDAQASGARGNAGHGDNYYTINVNQPVSTPADMLRQIRTESQYGLMVGEALA